MGRPAKPTNLKIIEGNKGKRSLNKQEPDPQYLTDLTAPDWLPKSAKAVWDEVIPHLRNAHLVTLVDVQPLAMGCMAIAQYRYAAMRTGDEMVKAKHKEDEEGKLVEYGEHVNPWLIVQSMSFKQAMAMFQQFGMSPAARTRISVNPQGDLFGNSEGKTGTDYFS
ncbi:phage terminase small subunit P27 family [Methylobacillus pratensis]